MAWWSRKRRNTPEAEPQPERREPASESPAPDLPVAPGMTPYEVTERLGPPLDVMDLAGLIGGSAFAISRGGPRTGVGGPARPSELPAKLFWLYLDVPVPGLETDIVFDQGRLSSAKVRGHGLPPQDGVEHPWAHELITEHVARVESDRHDGLTSRAGWHALTGAEATDFVLNHPKQPSDPGPIQANARRFGELDVLVSLFDTTAADEIRGRMPEGYLTTLDTLLSARGIRLGDTDIAHWILGREGERTVAHLTYVAADRSLPALMPWDLLSEAERAGGHQTG